MKIENKSKIIGLAAFVAATLITFGCSSTTTNPIEQTSSNQLKAQNSPPEELTKEITNTSSSIPPKNMSPGKVPTNLIDAGEFGENIYDFVKAKNWTKAAEKIAALQKISTQMASEKNSNSQLETIITNLEKAVASKDESTALPEANQVTFIVADLTAKYNPVVPIEVVKLDFYGRELEIWSMAKDEAKLKATAQAIRGIWNSVKSKVEAKGGTRQAKAFEILVVNVETAKTPDDFTKVAKPIFDEVDNLEKVFEG